MPNELFAIARSERTSASQQEDGLEDGRFSGAVLTGNEIEIRRELERCGFDTPQILDPQLGQGHRSRVALDAGGLQPHWHHDVFGVRDAGRTH
jgi:hypothetical protein